MVAFALQAVKDFINLSHHQNLFGLLFLSFCADGIFLVDDNVSFRFLHFYFIALRNLFAYPPGDILRCGIKWEYFVQIFSVTTSLMRVKSTTIPSELSRAERQ